MKLRELKEKVAHKVHHEDDLQDVARDDDNAFMHMTSKDTGAAISAETREKNPRSVY